MNKKELVDLVAEKSNLSKADANNAVDAVFEAITEALVAGDDFTYIGFGKFAVRSRAERTGRNPHSGEEIKIEATKVVSFKAGKPLKDAVANN